MKSFTIELPYLPPVSFSPNFRGHWSKRHRDGRVVKENVQYLLMEQFRPIPSFRRVELHYTIVVPDRRRRDYDNFVARGKPITDALVDAGVIPDDTP